MVGNFISVYQAQKKWWTEYSLKKELRRLISKIKSYHQQNTFGIVSMAEEYRFTFLCNNVDDDFNYTKKNF